MLHSGSGLVIWESTSEALEVGGRFGRRARQDVERTGAQSWVCFPFGRAKSLEVARHTPSRQLFAAASGLLGERGASMSEQAPQQSPGHSGPHLENVEGLVKWFDPRKGFGFIVGPEGQDIFAHYSVIQGDGFRVLKDGSPVIYDATKTDKGWKATRVIRNDAVPDVVVPKRGHSRTTRR